MSSMLRAAAIALAYMTLPAVAQTPEGPTLPEINVQASRVTTSTVGQTTTGTPGVPIQHVSLSYGVSVAGLDLSSPSGQRELKERVSRAAMAACAELGRQFPGSTTSDSDCIKAATSKAMTQVRQVEAAATRK